jgi:hypothetical protein
MFLNYLEKLGFRQIFAEIFLLHETGARPRSAGRRDHALTDPYAGKVGAEPGYAPRFPRLISFREGDKKPEDATTVQELIELYQSQGKKKWACLIDQVHLLREMKSM